MLLAAPAYCHSRFSYARRLSREVQIGTVAVGGSQPIRVQSMTTTRTQDIDATLAQSIRLIEAGCEIVRITAPTTTDAQAIGEIKRRLRARGIHVPLVADIHFSPAAALEAAEHVEKVRVNPGNFADQKFFRVREYTDEDYAAEIARIEERFTPLVLKCQAHGVAMRIGSNHGSLSDRIMNRYGDTPAGMVESALEFVRIARKHDYHDIVLSMKASNPKVMIQAYRLLVARMDEEGLDPYPLHLGVTEAGLGEDGRIKSAVGIGALLDDGLGDTVRVSLTEEPEAEVPVAQRLVEPYNKGLASARACPEPAIERVDPYSYTRRLTTPVTISGRPSPQPTSSWPTGDGSSVVTAHGERLNPRESQSSSAGSEVHLPVVEGEPPNARATRSPSVEEALSVPVGGERAYPREGRSSTDKAEVPSLVVGGGATVAVLEPPEEALTSAGSAYSTGVGMGTDVEGVDLSALARLEQPVPWYDAVRAYRSCAAAAADKPLHLQVTVDGDELEVLLRTATVMGSLLCDGLGDSVGLTAPGSAEDHSRLLFGILQAAGVRITKTEFVSCPSCGRTLFDLQTTTERIAARTSHLKGVKIAIMGCVVNGPGEMADADFGYVGGSPGHVNLYVGKEVVEKAVPEGQADERLVDLIRRHGKWQEPAEQV